MATGRGQSHTKGRMRRSHTNEEIVDIGVVNLRQMVVDTVAAWRALGVDWPTIRSGLHALVDQTKVVIQECVEEDVKERKASGNG